MQVLNAYSLIAKHLHARLTRGAHASDFLALPTSLLIYSSASHLEASIRMIEIVPARFIALRIPKNEEFNLSENLPKALETTSLSFSLSFFA